MLSLFVVNANLAPTASPGEAAVSNPGQGLGPNPPREPCVGRFGAFFFFFSFFFPVWRVLLPFIFTVKCWRQTGQHGGEELIPPPPWPTSPLLTPREAPGGGFPDPQPSPFLAVSPAQGHHPVMRLTGAA